MLIAPYDEKYRENILKIVEAFYAEALKDYSAPIDSNVLQATIEKYKDTAFLLIVDGECVGVIAGMAAQSPLNGKKIYQELIFYVDKPHRTKGVIFLKKVEAMLKDQGYSQVVMALMANSRAEKLEALYNRMGYTLLEKHYLKNL